MGGFSSGRSGWRRKVEAQHAVDIRWMKRNGWLFDGHVGTLTWSNQGEETGSISYRVAEDTLILDYKHREQGGEWEPAEPKIRLTYTPCHYGGERVWMLCPNCWRRCAKIYLAGKYPACRKCYNLAYYSEAETQLDRAMRRARRAQEKLGYDGGCLDEWIPKPKGMHRKTYERHLRVIQQANAFFSAEIMRRFNMVV